MHGKMITFNLLYLVSFLGILGLTPIGGSVPMLNFSWEGINIGPWAGLGAFTWLIPIDQFIGVVVPIITSIIVGAILATTRVIDTGLSFSPFKLLALIMGIAVSVGVGGAVLGMMPEVPAILKMIFVYPSVLMLVYSLVIDIGTWGS